MARTRQQIYNSLVDFYVATAASLGVVVTPGNWSIYDQKRFLLNATSEGGAIQEQLYDSFRDDMEVRVRSAYSATAPWIQNVFLNVFESSAPNVPAPKLNTTTFYPEYSVPNLANRVVKYCAVVPGQFGTTVIKIAGSGPNFLVGYVVDAAQNFIDTFGVPGINYKVVSKPADRLFLVADIYYKGIYSPVIQSSVIAAINKYLLDQSTLNFGQTENGKIDVSDLIVAIKGVPGVKSVVILDMRSRPDTMSAGTGIVLVQNSAIVQKDLSTVAGYIIPENAAGYQFTDFRAGSVTINNLNFIAQ